MAIGIFLTYAAHKNFDVYQMDKKCAFLNDVLEETGYVEQPPGFLNDKLTNHFYILEKVVYGLKQTPLAWYAMKTNFFEDCEI